jgi:tetratricopeptide (TPR) repeat protein
MRGPLRPRTVPTALVLLAAAAASCAAPGPPPRARAPDPEIEALARRTEALLFEDRPAEACEAARAAAGRDPGGPEALRALQAARTAAGEDAGVRQEAERAVEQRPGDAVALYLLARTEQDPAEALRLVRRSLSLDPSQIWARLGLAQLLLGRGDEGGARRALDDAEAVAPGHAWVPLLRAQAAMKAQRPDRALDLLREAVRRDPLSVRARDALGRHLLRAPGGAAEARGELAAAFALAPRSRSLAEAWRESLESRASPGECRAAVAAVDAAERAGPPTPQALHLRGAARLGLDDAEGALGDLWAALEAGEERTAVLDDLRTALFSLGRYAEAVAAEEACTPPGVLRDPLSETDSLRGELDITVAALGVRPRDPDLLARLTDLCRRAGWLREAALLAAHRVAADPGDDGALADAAETARTLRFLDEFRALWRGAYRAYSAGGGGGDLEAALASLRGMSLRVLGTDLTRGIARTRYAMLGEMAESVRATGPCAEWFRDHGLALLLGREAGQPVEARLVRVVSLRRDREERVLGRRFRATVVLGEGLLVPSRREAGGAVLGGATIGDLVFVDLEGVGRWCGAAVRARRDPDLRAVLAAVDPLAAPDEEAEATLRFPGRLSERIAAGVEAWSDPRVALADFLDAARRHELTHAADASRYLPVLGHPLAGLRLLLRGRLSAEGVAAVLEGDAEISAVASAREPRASLATLVSFLPSRDAAPPHSRGYCDAVDTLVAVLRERQALPAGVNVLRSLDRLDPDTIRSAALEVCRRRGLTSE